MFLYFLRELEHRLASYFAVTATAQCPHTLLLLIENVDQGARKLSERRYKTQLIIFHPPILPSRL